MEDSDVCNDVRHELDMQLLSLWMRLRLFRLWFSLQFMLGFAEDMLVFGALFEVPNSCNDHDFDLFLRESLLVEKRSESSTSNGI